MSPTAHKGRGIRDYSPPIPVTHTPTQSVVDLSRDRRRLKVRISKAEKVVLLGITQTDQRVDNYTAVLCVRARRGWEAGIHFISHSFINPHLWLQERVNKG